MLAHSRQVIGGSAPSVERPAARNSPLSPKKSAHVRILVVDDEPLVRWCVSETLTEQGYEVTEAGDGASALRAFSAAAGAADVVLLDLHLPDSDDLRVLSMMRRAAPATPVIVMTAYGSPEELAEARRLGAFAVMDKPFEMNALAPLVERALAARPN